jgi:hypothetical protein
MISKIAHCSGALAAFWLIHWEQLPLLCIFTDGSRRCSCGAERFEYRIIQESGENRSLSIVKYRGAELTQQKFIAKEYQYWLPILILDPKIEGFIGLAVARGSPAPPPRDAEHDILHHRILKEADDDRGVHLIARLGRN